MTYLLPISLSQEFPTKKKKYKLIKTISAKPCINGSEFQYEKKTVLHKANDAFKPSLDNKVFVNFEFLWLNHVIFFLYYYHDSETYKNIPI